HSISPLDDKGPSPQERPLKKYLASDHPRLHPNAVLDTEVLIDYQRKSRQNEPDKNRSRENKQHFHPAPPPRQPWPGTSSIFPRRITYAHSANLKQPAGPHNVTNLKPPRTPGVAQMKLPRIPSVAHVRPQTA